MSYVNRTLATPANMKRFEHVVGMVAYSPTTGEEYSADARDYFGLGENEAQIAANGEDMVLVVRRSYPVDVNDVVALA
jgi:hypothetical protein